MSTKKSKILVIDTSIARAAGPENAVHPTSKSCRDFLETVRKVCHRMAWTDEIGSEWKKHMSSFSRQWLVSMHAKKKVVRVTTDPMSDTSLKILNTTVNLKERQALEKDLILFRAAIAADNTIASLDEAVRSLFSAASKSVGEIRHIVWVNPDTAAIDVHAWLAGGAEKSHHAMLYGEEEA